MLLGKITHIPPDERITLRDIKIKYHLSTMALAAIANVDISIVWTMESRGLVDGKVADKILAALSRVTGQCYKRETVGGYWVQDKDASP